MTAQNNFSKSAKSQLAKLMATENIRVEHKAVSTALFDTMNRILVLPIWAENMSNDVYDLFVGHEVGHALETPDLSKNYNNHIDTIEPDKKKHRGASSFFNVVEDARIERLMKIRYPGLRRSFIEGYKELLNQRDFFGIKNRDPNSLPFIDRINIHYKLGSASPITFSKEELAYIDKLDKITTYKEAVDLTKGIYEYVKYGTGLMGYGDGSEDGELSPTKKSEGSKNLDDIENPDDFELGEPSEAEKPEEHEESDVESGPHQQGEDETPDEEKENNEGGRGKPKEEAPEAKTDMEWEKNKEKLGSKNLMYEYVTIPEGLDLDDFIAPFEESWALFSPSPYMEEAVTATLRSKIKEFRKDNDNVISYLAREFEMKKAADQHARASVSKTGMMDMNKVHSYKYNEDIFKRITTVPGGKNHGLVMFIDWSSSMDTNIAATIEQMLNLIFFCKKVQIPFEVYAFSDVYNRNKYTKQNGVGKSIYQDSDIYIRPGEFTLIELISSRLRPKQYDDAILMIFSILARFKGGGYQLPWSGKFELGGTPLNQTILCAMNIVPRFRERYKLQVVNTIFLTDGEGSQLQYKWEQNLTYDKGKVGSAVGMKSAAWGTGKVNQIIRDNKTRAEVLVMKNQTIALLQILKERTSSYNIGFFLTGDMNEPYIKSKVEVSKQKVQLKNYEKFKFIVVEDKGYDQYYHIESKSMVLDATPLNLGASHIAKSVEQIANNFSTFMKKKIVNRVMLSQFIAKITQEFS